jgi:hypothetical protein
MPTACLHLILGPGNYFKEFSMARLFSPADQIIVPSSRTRGLMRSLGFVEERMTLIPNCVDNNWWATQAAQVDHAAMRPAWGVEPDTTVVLFCAKLQPWKWPGDLLQTFPAVCLAIWNYFESKLVRLGHRFMYEGRTALRIRIS